MAESWVRIPVGWCTGFTGLGLASLPCPAECGGGFRERQASRLRDRRGSVWRAVRFQRPRAFGPREACGAGERRRVLAGSCWSTGWWRLLTLPLLTLPLPRLLLRVRGWVPAWTWLPVSAAAGRQRLITRPRNLSAGKGTTPGPRPLSRTPARPVASGTAASSPKQIRTRHHGQ